MTSDPRLARIPIARWPTREEALSSRLFSPVRVGACTSRARTWVPAMVPWRASDEGFVTDEVLDWYGRFADGEPGVLVVEATGIRDVPSGPLLRVGDDRFVPGLRELAEVVRARSKGRTRLFLQILDFLAVKRRPAKEAWVRRFLRLSDAHRERLRNVEGGAAIAELEDAELREQLLALPHASLLAILSEREVEELEKGYRERVTDVALPHVRELPRVLPGLFAAAAERTRAAGFDGVELHFAHAYTMASFLSRTNDRADGYGGSLAGRSRLGVEVARAVRERVGDDWTVGCRILGDEVVAGGSRVADAAYHAVQLARAGLDFVSVSVGGKFDDAKQPKVGEAVYPYTGPSGHECMPTVKIEGGPFGRNLHFSRAIRSEVRAAGFAIPIVGAGGINDFDGAERAIASESCDLVAAARQSLADPDWWRKIELGRGDAIRRCLYTNYCEALDQRHMQVTCQLWDHDMDAEGPGHTGIARSSDGKRRLVPPRWSEDAASGVH